jgi:hypothetical protein
MTLVPAGQYDRTIAAVFGVMETVKVREEDDANCTRIRRFNGGMQEFLPLLLAGHGSCLKFWRMPADKG